MSDISSPPPAGNHTDHSHHSEEIEKRPSRTRWLDDFQRWCIGHTGISMGFGFLLILFGVYVSDHDAEHVLPTVLSHFAIIAGEAIVVMFFLHLFIEKLNNQGHENVIKNLVKVLSSKMHTEVDSLMTDFRNEAEVTTARLKENFFAAILHDKMPHKFVDQVLKNEFFNTSVLRENLVVKYEIKEENGALIIINDLEFRMTYVSGKEKYLEYDMPFSLSDTPQISYKFETANYRYLAPDADQSTVDLEEETHFKKDELGKSKEKDQFSLLTPIKLKKDESLQVQQRFIATHNNFNGLLQDIYYVNQHTLDITVSFKVADGFSVNVYPTFPEKMLPKVTPKNKYSKEDVYRNIPFLVPGQGYMFSIKKDVAK